MKTKLLCLALVLSGCATNRAAMLRSQYRSGDPELAAVLGPAAGAPVGMPLVAGKIVRWHESEQALRAQFPGVAFDARGDWLSARLPTEGQMATVQFGFRDGRLIGVRAVFEPGAALRSSYQHLEWLLDAQLGDPDEQVDAKVEAMDRVPRVPPVLAFLGVLAAGIQGDPERVDLIAQEQADAVAEKAQIAAQVPEHLESVWDREAGQVALLADEDAEVPLQVSFVPRSRR